MPWYTDNLGPIYTRPDTATEWCKCGISSIYPDSFTDYIKKEFDKLTMQATLVPDINWEIKYIGNLNNIVKETNKMEAKKCDRCGKLYEMPGAMETIGAEVRFKHKYVPDAEDLSGSKIAEKQTERVYLTRSLVRSDTTVDLCPECRKSLKKWFESTDKEEKK